MLRLGELTGEVAGVVSRMARVGLPYHVIGEQRLGKDKGTGYVGTWGRLLQVKERKPVQRRLSTQMPAHGALYSCLCKCPNLEATEMSFSR